MTRGIASGIEGVEARKGTVSHDPSTPDLLAAFMSTDWAPTSPQVDGAADVAAFTVQRRSALSAHFPGEWIVIPTGGLQARASDMDYAFRPGSDHYWLTGSLEPDGVLVLAPTAQGHDATLFVAPRMDRSTAAFFTDRRHGELWVGPRLGLDAELLLGISCAPLDQLPTILKQIEKTPARVLRGFDDGVEALLPTADFELDEDEMQPDVELAQTLSELRLVKDAHEITMLQEAVDATTIGFRDAVRELRTAKQTSNGERWIEGTFWRRARAEGNDVGYGSIVACGPHACTLHWTDNSGPVKDGDLALLDMGVESVELYTADVTRTIPISGRFTEVQREVYDAVYAAQRCGLAAVKPGAAFLDPHNAAMRILTEWLVDKGILACSVDDALSDEHQYYRRYTLHGTSHMLGLDVHDCASARSATYRHGTLAPGMCLTVEPGLYFQPDDLTVPERYRGIGVRIEDDVLVTEAASRTLSSALPTKADEVEAWMADLLG